MFLEFEVVVFGFIFGFCLYLGVYGLCKYYNLVMLKVVLCKCIDVVFVENIIFVKLLNVIDIIIVIFKGIKIFIFIFLDSIFCIFFVYNFDFNVCNYVSM